MDENHQDMPASKPIATEDIKWVLNKKSNLLVPVRTVRTGFEDKTRWDRLLLYAQVIGAFAIPLSIIALIIGVWQFNAQQIADRQKTAAQQQAEFQNLKDQQQQTTLETYLDRMSDLLFTQHLDTSKPKSEVRQVARARTLTALPNLNPARKEIFLQFLYTSGLIQAPTSNDHGKNPIITLEMANLSQASLSFAILYGADLNGADLSGANLSRADLSGADLNGANLGCYTSGSGDICSFLNGADLSGVNLSKANLSKADLIGVNLSFADLGRADLSGADLRCYAPVSGDIGPVVCSDLSLANLNGANLNGANLSDADLSNARVTQAQLNTAWSLQGATMPDGSIHP